MKKHNKKIQRIFFIAMLTLSIAVLYLSSITLTVSAQTDELKEDVTTNIQDKPNNSVIYTIEKVVNELFADKTIKSCEYLCNLDESTDYVYTEFENGGYAVFLKQTMEMLEYSAQGKLHYPESSSAKYYGGPGLYLVKDKDCFINVSSQEYIFVTQESTKTYSAEVREMLLSNSKKRADRELVEFDYSSINSTIFNESSTTTNEVRSNPPDYDASNLIRLSRGIYIPNYRYFLLDPSHGRNVSGTCGAVATQILLGYHNYYSDRRIIPNVYLNGSITEPESNPNYCTDPMLMTSETLGSRGENENGNDDPNSYFHYIVDKIPSNASIYDVKNGINDIIDERNDVIGNGISYTSNVTWGGGFLWTSNVNSEGIIEELDSGRPVIILMQERLGGTDHYVVAYGYDNYTYPDSTDYYLGYITHFGWKTWLDGTNFLNVWINSSWCGGYISLNIEHTHRYINVGTIEGTNRTEYNCSLCGHRTDAAINVAARDRYVELIAPIPQNGYTYKDYYVNFATGGNKLFQTFGTKDTKLYLFDTENNQLTYNDDFGESANSFFQYSVQAQTRYILRVEIYPGTPLGDVKIAITPASGEFTTFEDIQNTEGQTAAYNFTTFLNVTRIFTFTPTTNGTYTFKTNYSTYERIDTCLYVVDPRNITPCLFDDDSAGDLQALISMDLIAGRTYFIVVSVFDITAQSGAMRLIINKT